jgi:polysaccharide pyruvyl transferase WcaK-like protein
LQLDGQEQKEIAFHLIGWHGQGAHGDDLLAAAVRRLFNEMAGESGIALSWSAKPETADYILVGGGTLLGIDNIGILETIQRCRKPYSIFGAGFRREKRDIGEENIKKLRALIDGADFVLLRGYLSKQFCVHNGIARGEVIGDPAFQFRPEPLVLKDDAVRRVGISIRSMDEQCEPQYTNNDHCLDTVLKIAKFLSERISCDFYLFDMARNIYDEDKLAIDELLPQLKACGRCHVVPFSRGPEKSFSTVAQMDYMISQRLHPSIVAWSCGIPHVNLDYQNGKTEDFLSSIGMTEFGIRTDQFTLTAYKVAYNRLAGERGVVMRHASMAVDFWREKQRQVAIQILRAGFGRRQT